MSAATQAYSVIDQIKWLGVRTSGPEMVAYIGPIKQVNSPNGYGDDNSIIKRVTLKLLHLLHLVSSGKELVWCMFVSLSVPSFCPDVNAGDVMLQHCGPDAWY